MNRNLNRRIHPIAEADWLSPKKHRNGGRVMAQVKIYSKKDKRFVNFPIACTPSGDECKKCQLKYNCDKFKNQEEE